MNETFFQYVVIAIFVILGAGVVYKLKQKRKEKYTKKIMKINNEIDEFVKII